MSGLLASYIENPPPGATVLRDGGGTDATVVIAPEGTAVPGAVAIRMSEDNGGGTEEEPGYDECFFSVPADKVEEFITALRAAAAFHSIDPDETK